MGAYEDYVKKAAGLVRDYDEKRQEREESGDGEVYETAQEFYKRVKSEPVSDDEIQNFIENADFDSIAELRDICKKRGYVGELGEATLTYALQAASERDADAVRRQELEEFSQSEEEKTEDAMDGLLADHGVEPETEADDESI